MDGTATFSSVKEIACLLLHLAAGEQADRPNAPGELTIEKDVLVDGKLVDERQVLVDGLDTAVTGFLGPAVPGQLATDLDRSLGQASGCPRCT